MNVNNLKECNIIKADSEMKERIRPAILSYNVDSSNIAWKKLSLVTATIILTIILATMLTYVFINYDKNNPPSSITAEPTIANSSSKPKDSTPGITPTSSPTNLTGLTLGSIQKTDLSQYANVQEVKCSEEANAEFILTTDYILTNFKLVSIAYDGIDDGVNWHINNIYYEQPELKPDTALQISAYINDISTDLLVIYDDQEGNAQKCFIAFDLRGYSDVGLYFRDTP